MNHAIILAGGRGTRFWPLSRENYPKQFLNLSSNKPLIQETVNRLERLIKKENIYIASNKIHEKNLKLCLEKLDIPVKNLFFEPESKNTFAPIALLAKNIYQRDKNGVILVLPSDHYIKNESKFIKALDKAVGIAQEGFIVTLGITPDRPETGYGYIKIKEKRKGKKEEVYRVERFVEKPDLERVKEFIKDKRYFWNGGIFVFRAEIILQEIRKFLPRDYNITSKISGKKDLSKFWPKLTCLSIDYALMEKTDKLALIPVDFGWLDLGNLGAIEYFSKKNKYGNILKGSCVDIGSRNILALSDNQLLATIGLDNLVIITTKDAVLVCSKEKLQDVGKVVRLLKEKKLFRQI